MSGKAVINDKMPQFRRSMLNVMDNALREAARDTLINARIRTPYGKTGHLRSESDIKKVGNLKWRVSYYKVYARFQEFGGDSKRRVRRYTTSGTGKAYLKTAGDDAVNRINFTLMKHGRRARP